MILVIILKDINNLKIFYNKACSNTGILTYPCSIEVTQTKSTICDIAT